MALQLHQYKGWVGILTVSEKAKHLFLTGRVEAAAERNSLFRSFCLGQIYEELPKEVGGWGKIEEQALERAHGGNRKPCICEKSFLPLSNWVTWGKSVSEPQSPHLQNKDYINTRFNGRC